MQKSQLAFTYLVFGSALGLSLLGCGDDASSSAGDDVLAAESELTAARQSFAAARSEAGACFETYRTCVESGDEATCRAQLKACLPAEAPMPQGCGRPGSGDASVGDGGARPERPSGDHRGSDRSDAGTAHGDGGVSPAPGDGGRPEGRGRAGEGEGEDERECDGGMHAGDGGHSGGMQSADGGRGGGRTSTGAGAEEQVASSGLHLGDMRCRPPRMPEGALGSCGDRATSTLAQGSAPSAAATMHDHCVSQSFEEQIAKLCAKAVELCASANAPADVCTRVTQACSDIGDAGSHRPDAGT